ncbi:hypothetical protein GTP91_32865 [Rugamonas sp. FT82W]|uniref:Lipoprotein n=1 Tax=Duganella vulcania TaxID=2692166 RepID=A0A845GGL6_9BURK|nr:hypothetical protein [Duganella vulcania]MYM91957.1 hypothetical protein [Duganella vulcania]
MKLSRVILILCCLALLGGCASSSPHMAEVRAFAAQAPHLGAYHELTERYRTTYQREQPFLSAAADLRERQLDQQRQASSEDFARLQTGVQAYMQALGRLAGDKQYDLEDQVKSMSGGIKAWPEHGIDERHVNAYAGLARLIARTLTRPAQDSAVRELLRDGHQAMQELLGAMRTLLRLYDKSSDNEQKIVLGMLETELPFVDTRRDRLLLALSKSLQHDKQAEYRLTGARNAQAQRNLAAIEQSHRALFNQIPQQ